MKSFLDDGNRRSTLSTLLKVLNITAHGQSYAGSVSNVSSYKTLVDDFYNWVVNNVL